MAVSVAANGSILTPSASPQEQSAVALCIPPQSPSAAKVAHAGIKHQGYTERAELSAFSGRPGLDILSG